MAWRYWWQVFKQLQQKEASADVMRDASQAFAALPAQRPSAWMPLQILVTACTAFMHEDRCRLAVLLLHSHQHAKGVLLQPGACATGLSCGEFSNTMV